MVEKLFISEFSSKYNIPSSQQSAVKAMFKSSMLDVKEM